MSAVTTSKQDLLEPSLANTRSQLNNGKIANLKSCIYTNESKIDSVYLERDHLNLGPRAHFDTRETETGQACCAAAGGSTPSHQRQSRLRHWGSAKISQGHLYETRRIARGIARRTHVSGSGHRVLLSARRLSVIDSCEMIDSFR